MLELTGSVLFMNISRRTALKGISAGAAALGGSAILPTTVLATAAGAGDPCSRDLQGKVNHSVCRWPYRSLSVEQLASAARDMGIGSLELVGPPEFATLREYGLVCAMSNGPGTIERGFNRLEHHDELVAGYERMIPQVAQAGFERIIAFSGNRRGLGDEQGIANCVTGLKRVMPAAERYGVVVCMEMLNSKIDHPDYHADTTAFAVAIADGVGSDNFRLLYDIYHMQIMEGDLIRTIRDNAEYIAHFHTGGVPGRNEIDEAQELNYRAIVQAIVETGYDGWIGQEFVPTRDPLTSLREAIAICDV